MTALRLPPKAARARPASLTGPAVWNRLADKRSTARFVPLQEARFWRRVTFGIGRAVAALGLLVEALTVAEQVEDDDLRYVDGVLRTARSVYNSHVSLVHSALIFEGQDLVAFAESYETDPGITASRQAFDTLTTTDFPEFRATVTKR